MGACQGLTVNDVDHAIHPVLLLQHLPRLPDFKDFKDFSGQEAHSRGACCLQGSNHAVAIADDRDVGLLLAFPA